MGSIKLNKKYAYHTIWGSVCGGMVIRVRFDICDKRKQKQLDKIKKDL